MLIKLSNVIQPFKLLNGKTSGKNLSAYQIFSEHVKQSQQPQCSGCGDILASNWRQVVHLEPDLRDFKRGWPHMAYVSVFHPFINPIL